MRNLFFIFLSFPLLAQINGKITDASGKPIPFANIQQVGEKEWLTSGEDGGFVLKAGEDGDVFLFSAVGFREAEVKRAEADLVVLEEDVEILREVSVNVARKRKSVEIAEYRSGGIRFTTTARHAKFFPMDETMRSHPFLKEIRFYSDSKLTSALVNVRILSVTEDGNPGSDLLPENHIVSVKKGHQNNKVDFSKYPIEMPETGLFIVLEPLRVPENIYEDEIMVPSADGSSRPYRYKTYQPFFGYLPAEKNTTWSLEGNKWSATGIHRMKDPKSFSNILMKKYHEKYLDLALSAIFTD